MQPHISGGRKTRGDTPFRRRATRAAHPGGRDGYLDRPARGLIAALALGICAITPTVAPAQEAAASGSASAQVVRPLRAVSVADLSFGRIALSGNGTAGGTVAIDPRGGLPSYTGAVQAMCGAEPACQPHPARFAVSGEPGRAYRVMLPASVEARGQRSAARLTVHTLTTHSLAPSENASGLLDAEGEGAFSVGGTLSVPSQALPDVYHASVPVTVTYD